MTMEHDRADTPAAEQAEPGRAPLMESRQFSGAMFDANPYINLIFDDKRRLVDCNPAAMEYFGFSDKQALLRQLPGLLMRSVPEFQPDGSPSTPLTARFDYAVQHGQIEFESEVVLANRRIPLLFTLKKLPYGDSYAMACYIVDMLTLKEARNELMRRDLLMRQVNRAATRLMSAEPDKFDSVMVKILKSLGQSVGASQMHIWQTVQDDEGLRCRRLYLWDSEARGGNPEPDRELDYAAFPQWRDQMLMQRSVHLQCCEAPESHVLAMVGKSAKVILLIPVYVQGEFWGFVGLAKSQDETLFSPIEEKTIQNAGILIVSATVRNQNQKSLIEARQAAMASDKAKSAFLSRMSHEIRTPMNAIIGVTAIARKARDMAQVQQSLAQISTASQQLLNIINDILDMSKIESGKLELVSAPFDFRRMLAGAVGVIQVKIDEKQLRFTQDCAGEFDRYMVGDELRLSQVFINLLTNAVKFTPPGGAVALRASHRPGQNGRQVLRVEVQDTGIGISAEQQSRLFRSFEQADGSITRRFGGTGLGLAICKNIVRMMNGSIWVESEPDQGSTFIFEVEFCWGDALEAVAEGAVPAPDSYAWPGKRLLLVEDVAINREIIRGLLADTGLTIDCAENGLSALDVMDTSPGEYDLVLMDLQMPVMDGLEATRRIRALGGLAAEIPIIAMTANAFVEDVQKCLAAGMNDHLAKPIDVDLLLKKLADYLGKHNQTGG